MSKPSNAAGGERGLEDLLIRSLESLRESPAERERFPALDRMLSRIEARERRLAGRGTNPLFVWLRRLAPVMTAAAAGFAGAALALAVVPGRQGPPMDRTVVAAKMPTDSRESLDRTLQRLEAAVHGLENLQPLLESRIEWVEDVVQRKHQDAYLPVDDRGLPHRVQGPRRHSRKRSGV